MNDITYEGRVTLAKLCGKTLSDKWHSPGLVYIEGASGSAPIVWQPDVDLNQTFECVEAIRLAGGFVSVATTSSEHPYEGFTKYRSVRSIADYDTPAVAICRAILEALPDE